MKELLAVIALGPVGCSQGKHVGADDEQRAGFSLIPASKAERASS